MFLVILHWSWRQWSRFFLRLSLSLFLSLSLSPPPPSLSLSLPPSPPLSLSLSLLFSPPSPVIWEFALLVSQEQQLPPPPPPKKSIVRSMLQIWTAWTLALFVFIWQGICCVIYRIATAGVQFWESVFVQAGSHACQTKRKGGQRWWRWTSSKGKC